MVNLVWNLRDELESQSLLNFGPILHENWIIKREMVSGLSNIFINDLYDQAIDCGATGGKLLGVGRRLHDFSCAKRASKIKNSCKIL